MHGLREDSVHPRDVDPEELDLLAAPEALTRLTPEDRRALDEVRRDEK